MSLMSMTGFARSPIELDGAKLTWEIKTVNARGLDLRIRLPAGFDDLEPDVRQAARRKLARGTCFLSLQREDARARASLVLNENALALVVAAARRLAEIEGIAAPSADGLLAVPGVLVAADDRPGADDSERAAALIASLEAALDDLRRNRTEEGRRLHDVLSGQIGTIERHVDEAAGLADAALGTLKDRIAEQVAALTADDRKPLDPDRLHQEAVLMATRADVREEIDRLRGHIEAVRKQLRSSEPVGRRLEFLAQEFNREANTLCSKAFDRRLGATGIELKTIIDQFREQVQNVE